jgi:hypothetical protein
VGGEVFKFGVDADAWPDPNLAGRHLLGLIGTDVHPSVVPRHSFKHTNERLRQEWKRIPEVFFVKFRVILPQKFVRITHDTRHIIEMLEYDFFFAHFL